jgi:hypothetical protein
MVLLERLNAANAIRPTVAALSPVSSARTILGMLLGMERTPAPRAAMPTAPGNLRDKVREHRIKKRGYYRNFSTHDHRRNARNPASVPFLTSAIEKASCVDPGPGKAFPRVNRSLKVVISQLHKLVENNTRKENT